MISDKGVHVVFVMGKAKVVPRRITLTIPKLELIAATLGAKMHWQIKHSIKLKLAECYLYTDSTMVMDWLRNTDGRLKKWVARKISEINRYSDIDSWLKVPTIHNAADVCSRGADPRKADPKSVYLNAPAFLHETESHIALYELNAKGQCSTVETSCSNTCTTAIDCDSDLSNNVEFYCRHDVDIDDNDAIVYDNETTIELDFGRSDVPEYIQCLARRCSDYYECLKLIAYRYRYVVSKFIDKGSNVNVSLETGCLKNSELKRSMIDLIRLAQENYFDKQNIARIASHGLPNALQCCKKCDRAKLAELKNLLVFYEDHEKVLRVGGRITKASLPSETVHQYVLPKSHFITALIVKYSAVAAQLWAPPKNPFKSPILSFRHELF